MRPGWYYFWRFAWATSPGTYAKALYLGTGLSATNISLISSVSNIMDMIFGAVIGNFADRFKFLDASGYRNVGKEVILAVLFVVTTVLYGCQCVVSQFAVANTSSMMTLVGLSLDKLSIVSVLFLILAAVESAVKSGIYPVEKEIILDHVPNTDCFGSERVFGTYAWAIFHLLFGYLIDVFGTSILWIVKPFTCAVSLYVLWVLSQQSMPIHIPTTPKFEPTGRTRSISKSNVDDGGKAISETASTGRIRSISKSTSDDGYKTLGAAANHSNRSIAAICLTGPATSASSVSNGKSGKIKQPAVFMSFSLAQCGFILLMSLYAVGRTLMTNQSFIYFREVLGSSNTTIGISIFVGCILEAPVLSYSSLFRKKLGYRTLMVLGCVAFCVRVVGITYVQPGIVLVLLEMLHGVSFGFTDTAITYFVKSELADNHTFTSMESALSSFTKFVGIIGSVIAAHYTDLYGHMVVFRAFAMTMIIGLALYGGTVVTPADVMSKYVSTQAKTKTN
jgi:hypothetical protein